jgi:hypothetical protein
VLELSHIDPRSAALLVMDYQVDTLTRFDPRALRPLYIQRRSAPTPSASAATTLARPGVAPILGGFVPFLTAAIGRHPCRHAPPVEQAKSRKHMNAVLRISRSHGSWQSLSRSSLVRNASTSVRKLSRRSNSH